MRRVSGGIAPNITSVIPLMTALHPLFLCLANSLTETASLYSVRI
jgi:hypothetical protein